MLRFKATSEQVLDLLKHITGNRPLVFLDFDRSNTLAAAVLRPVRMSIHHDFAFEDVYYCIDAEITVEQLQAVGIQEYATQRPEIRDFPGENRRVSDWPAYEEALIAFAGASGWTLRSTKHT